MLNIHRSLHWYLAIVCHPAVALRPPAPPKPPAPPRKSGRHSNVTATAAPVAATAVEVQDNDMQIDEKPTSRTSTSADSSSLSPLPLDQDADDDAMEAPINNRQPSSDSSNNESRILNGKSEVDASTFPTRRDSSLIPYIRSWKMICQSGYS